MPFYQSVEAVQPPFGLGEDPNDLSQFGFNVLCQGIDLIQPQVDLANRIEVAGLGVINTSVFWDKRPTPESNDDSVFIHLLLTGGIIPLMDRNRVRTDRRTVQIIVKSRDPGAANTRAVAVYNELDGTYNQIL